MVALGACGSADTSTPPDTLPPAQSWTNVTIPSGDNEPARGGSLRMGLAADSNGWNPTEAQWAAQGYQVARAIFDPLAAIDIDGQVTPYLAAGFTSSDEFRAWDIGVRPGVVFHDGTPVDAQAIATNLQAHRDSALTGQALTPIESITVVDPATVRVEMSVPWSSFPAYLASQPGFVAAPATLTDPEGGRNPIGSGPFEFSEWTPTDELTVTRNDNYWQEGMPYLDEIQFVIGVEDNTRIRSFQAGELDVTELVTADAADRLRGDTASGDIQMLIDSDSESAEILIGMNTAQTPFDDVRARRAVAKAIDRETISEAVFAGLLPPATGPLQPDSSLYAEFDGQSYDPTEARRLADEIAAETGAPLTFSFVIPPDPGLAELAQTLQAQLAEVGITMTIENRDQAALFADALFGNYEATGFTLFSSGNGEDAYVFLHGDNVRPAGEFGLSLTRFQNDELDAALDGLRTTIDGEAMRADAATLQRVLAEEAPFVFVVETTGVVVANNRVRNLGQTTLPEGVAGIPLDGTNIWLHQLWLTQ
jgi:peptide/nickel transport system substrate-binding protein